ncbi:hypothetical protein Hanom_Chr01g00054601 [Helianthus anomalus]
MKIFFHTLLICLSAKTTSFKKIPLKTQYLGYAILTNSNYRLPQTLFLDMVGNVKSQKRGIAKAFLIYPRLLSYLLKSIFKQNIFEQGEPLQI